MTEASPMRGRSNSLQRMLELERQHMINRLRGAVPSVNRQAAPPQQPEAPNAPFSSSRTSTIQARRIESQANKHPQKPSQRPRRQSPCPQPRTLIIDVDTAAARAQGIAVRDSDHTMKMKRNKPVVTVPPSIPYSATVEALPSSGSPSRHSVCMSPSWEAYDRHRKEKKQEKKCKDEARATQSKPRRLSKPPPASSPYAFEQINRRNVSDTAVFKTSAVDQRPQSMIALNTFPKEDTIYRHSRSRTGSFTSLLKSPFDFRRSSVDHGAEPAFIGGIKLEAEKHAAHQMLLSEDSCAVEAETHPALRKVKSDQRSSVALKSPPPPPRVTAKDAKDPNRRAYPPITRMTTKNKTLSLISPTAPAVPDLSTIEKWRARVGFKSAARRASLEPKQRQGTNPTAETSTIQHAAPTVPVERHEVQNDSPSATDVTQKDSRSLTPPPEPPRRSSKRNSSMNLDGFSSIASSPTQSPKSTDGTYHVRNATEPRQLQPLKQPSPSPSWENLQSSVMDTIEKNIRPMQHGERAFWNSREWTVDRVSSPLQVPSSSSDDSASEGFNTISMPSTPNTSRPQSEKGFSQLSGEAGSHPLPRIELYDNAYPGETCSIRSASTFPRSHGNELDMDPIQAAAMRVMEAFPDMSETGHGNFKTDAAHRFEVQEPQYAPLRLHGKAHESMASSRGDLSSADDVSKELKGRMANPSANGPVAKVFVECCGCKYYHDMPSKLYNAMVDPSVVLSPKDRTEFAGAISMTVKCPWCKHEMSKRCCAGMAAMVYIKERLH